MAHIMGVVVSEIIREIMTEDSLQFVAYWSVDCNYRDGVNKPDIYFCKGNDGIHTVYEAIGARFGPLCIKVVDIFGNSALLTAEL